MHPGVIPHELAGEDSHSVGIHGDFACIVVGLLVATVLTAATFAAVLGVISSFDFLVSVLLVMGVFSAWAVGGGSDEPTIRHA